MRPSGTANALDFPFLIIRSGKAAQSAILCLAFKQYKNTAFRGGERKTPKCLHFPVHAEPTVDLARARPSLAEMSCLATITGE